MKIIAIASRVEELDGSYKYFCNASYIEKIIALGWTPVVIPTIDHIQELAQRCDALLIPGGYDIAACYFNESQHQSATLYDMPLDHYDFAILSAFVNAKKPILGICRGMQIINVFFGGSLHQDIDITKHVEGIHEHRISPQANTIFEQLLPPHSIVNSFHHQAVSKLSNELILGARSSDDGIEALVHKELPILGVQWHPEKQKKDSILPYFLTVLR